MSKEEFGPIVSSMYQWLTADLHAAQRGERGVLEKNAYGEGVIVSLDQFYRYLKAAVTQHHPELAQKREYLDAFLPNDEYLTVMNDLVKLLGHFFYTPDSRAQIDQIIVHIGQQIVQSIDTDINKYAYSNAIATLLLQALGAYSPNEKE